MLKGLFGLGIAVVVVVVALSSGGSDKGGPGEITQPAAASTPHERAVAATQAKTIGRRAARWRKGYPNYDSETAYRLVTRPCAGYATNGCWHVQVISRYGCPNYVAVEANEYQNRTIIGSLLDNNANGIPAETPIMFELTSNGDGPSTANDIEVTCT